MGGQNTQHGIDRRWDLWNLEQHNHTRKEGCLNWLPTEGGESQNVGASSVRQDYNLPWSMIVDQTIFS